MSIVFALCGLLLTCAGVGVAYEYDGGTGVSVGIMGLGLIGCVIVNELIKITNKIR